MRSGFCNIRVGDHHSRVDKEDAGESDTHQKASYQKWPLAFIMSLRVLLLVHHYMKVLNGLDIYACSSGGVLNEKMSVCL